MPHTAHLIRISNELGRLEKAAMETHVGPGAEKKTYQAEFPKKVPCIQPDCKGTAELAFTAYEDLDGKGNEGKAVVDLKKQKGKPGGMWLHDYCAVAVYFCRDCLEPTAKYNQG